jgi:hypothetical protein
MNRIPLEVFVRAIPKVDILEKGIKFNKLHKVLLNGKTGTKYNRNNALRDLIYYVELGNFFKIQNGNQQPQYYQTNVNNYDYVTEYIRPLLDRKFKTIYDNWEKLDKKKLFLKNGKPYKELEKWVEEFDSIITITQNLMWSRETMKDEILNGEYTLIIKNIINRINKFTKLVYSTSKVKEEFVRAVFARIPFPINL